MTKEEFISAVHKYRSMVLNYCKNRLNNYQDAEDMTNNIFSKLWVKHKYIRADTAENYIKIAMRNNYIDFLKYKPKIYKLPLTGYEGEHEDHTEDHMFFKEIEKVIDGLPPQQKRLIKMKYIEGILASEIAEMLGLSHSSIRNQLCTGLKNIRKRMEKVM